MSFPTRDPVRSLVKGVIISGQLLARLWRLLPDRLSCHVQKAHWSCSLVKEARWSVGNICWIGFLGSAPDSVTTVPALHLGWSCCAPAAPGKTSGQLLRPLSARKARCRQDGTPVPRCPSTDLQVQGHGSPPPLWQHSTPGRQSEHSSPDPEIKLKP